MERQRKIRQLKATGIQEKYLLEWNFAVAEDNKDIQMAKRYVEQWKKVKAENLGLLLWGDVGTGKSFVAACIANALMEQTVESIKQIGVVSPLIARPDPEGGYEILSGHRRLHAAQLAGLETVPVIVKEMDDDAAIIFMVDSNLQRENILPSERAFSYKMKLDAMKHQGTRNDLETTSRQVVGKLEAADTIGEQTGESGRQVQRFIRLTNLIPEILDMVDEKKIAFNPAVELSYLKPSEQKEFLEAMDYGEWRTQLLH